MAVRNVPKPPNITKIHTDTQLTHTHRADSDATKTFVVTVYLINYEYCVLFCILYCAECLSRRREANCAKK